MRRILIAAATTLLAAASLQAGVGTKVLGTTETGNPGIRSINAISFAPQGVLLIGDGTGGQVVAVDTRDTRPQQKLSAKIEAVNGKIAARFGTTAKGIEIVDLAVNPASGVVYLAVRKQDERKYAIVTVGGDGRIGELSLEKVRYAKLPLRAGKTAINRVTDVTWAYDRVIAAGRSNEAFASKIFSIHAPLSHAAEGDIFSAETYHVSHRKWETRAPMSVVLPYRENGKTYVVGAFSCTPVVKYPIESLKPGAKVKGESMIELGSGNRPIDMFTYQKDGKTYVLSNTFRFHHSRRPFGPSPYWTVRFEQSLLAGDAVNEKAVLRLKGNKPATPQIKLIEAYHGVLQMDRLDDKRAVVLRENKTGLSLEPLALP